MFESYTILLIDDDSEDQEIFLIALNEAFPSAECFFASNCPDAIENIANKRIPVPDYVFTDWNMPLMDGQKCIDELRALPGMENVKFFILSGSLPSLYFKNKVINGVEAVLVKQSSIQAFADQIKITIRGKV